MRAAVVSSCYKWRRDCLCSVSVLCLQMGERREQVVVCVFVNIFHSKKCILWKMKKVSLRFIIFNLLFWDKKYFRGKAQTAFRFYLHMLFLRDTEIVYKERKHNRNSHLHRIFFCYICVDKKKGILWRIWFVVIVFWRPWTRDRPTLYLCIILMWFLFFRVFVLLICFFLSFIFTHLSLSFIP